METQNHEKKQKEVSQFEMAFSKMTQRDVDRRAGMETQNHEKKQSECNRWRHIISRDGMQIEMTFITIERESTPDPPSLKRKNTRRELKKRGPHRWVSRPSVIQVCFVCLFFRCRQFFIPRGC